MSKVDDKIDLRPALSNATLRGHVEIVRLLLLKSAKEDDDLWPIAFRESYENGHSKLVRLILSWWSKRTARSPPADKVNKGLHLTVRNGHWSVISQMFENCPGSKESLDEKGVKKLILEASRHGRDGAVSELLAIDTHKKEGSRKVTREDETEDKTEDREESKEESQEVNKEDNKRQFNDALLKAAEFGSAAVIDLLAPTSDLEYKTGWLQWTALHYAASSRF